MANTFKTRRSASEILEILEAQQHSKLSIKQFCETHQISRALFYHWRAKHRVVMQEEGFLPLQLPVKLNDNDLFAEIQLSHHRIVRLFRDVDPSYLQAILRS